MPEVITDNLVLWTSALRTKSTAGRGSNGKLEAYGVKKLRALILELAVRGKLVQQDPNDEPADACLAKARLKLRAEGKGARRSAWKETALVSAEEKRFELPKGWVWARVNDTGFYVNGLAFKPTDWGVTGKPIIRIQNLTDSTKPLNYAQGEFPDEVTVRTGDLLVSWSATLDAFIWDRDEAVLNQHIFKVTTCHELVTHGFLYWLLKVSIREMEESDHAHGLVMTHINREPFLAHVVAIPPLAEQHRIVAKVDELMALCDQLEQQQTDSLAAHETLVEILLGTLTRVESQQEFSAAWARIASHFDTLFTTEASIEQLKQTILQLAVMGKLVPQDPNDEPASALLHRKQKSGEVNIPARIPESWAWARVDEFAQTRLGKMLDKAKNKGTLVRYLRNVNVRWFDFDLSDVKVMRFEESELEEFSLRRGDVLICEGGYPGRAAVWDEREANIYFQKAIHRVRFQNGVNPYYFVYVLRESADSGRLDSYFTGAGIQHFTGKGLSSFLVPLPPLPEQHRIVTKVDELMVLCNTLKARLAEAQATQLHLADAIVEQAVC